MTVQAGDAGSRALVPGAGRRRRSRRHPDALRNGRHPDAGGKLGVVAAALLQGAVAGVGLGRGGATRLHAVVGSAADDIAAAAIVAAAGGVDNDEVGLQVGNTFCMGIDNSGSFI